MWLPAGGYLVLGRNADSSSNGGVVVAYRYGGFTLGNADDEIILLDGVGTEIDRVAYDGGPAFPNPDGASMMLIRPDLDNAQRCQLAHFTRPLARQRRRPRLTRRSQSGHPAHIYGYLDPHPLRQRRRRLPRLRRPRRLTRPHHEHGYRDSKPTTTLTE